MEDLKIQTIEAPTTLKEVIRPVTLKCLTPGSNGEILAILNPSESGKTTLLKAHGDGLNGRLGGAITYNNKPLSNAVKRNTNFVTQYDFLYPYLMVTKNLFYIALLCFPNTLSKAKKAMEAKAMIIQLELNKCKNNVETVGHGPKFNSTRHIEDAVYKIKSKKSTKKEEKVILNGVSGLIQMVKILAILGLFGSGEMTLLMKLRGQLGSRLGGVITYNNKPFSNAVKRNTGFVTQDNFLYPYLRVIKNLFYTALLRLPNTLSKAEKAMQGEAVIIQLELHKCKYIIKTVGHGPKS
ncbi:PREDICTED: ABC transporter [Prunus dulcis]|uniref:PREDICTED: ABC transporter n=1 Tax=Prunus dulcis TaxID=3755 RepID=A0A5E4FNR8_PRUDU|nr:PREDICTED: ABC transporter [Prunus dulcis]